MTRTIPALAGLVAEVFLQLGKGIEVELHGGGEVGAGLLPLLPQAEVVAQKVVVGRGLVHLRRRGKRTTGRKGPTREEGK